MALFVAALFAVFSRAFFQLVSELRGKETIGDGFTFRTTR